MKNMSYGWLSGAMLAVVSALAHASPARACTIPPPVPTFVAGSPLDGESAVPTDVVPFYQIPIGVIHGQLTEVTEVPGSFTLATASGDEVAIAVRLVHDLFYEITPSEPLAPNTEHVLRGEWVVDTSTHIDELRFTTGSGPVEGQPRAPEAHLVHYEATEPQVSTCELSGPIGTCVWDAHGDQLVEIAVVSDRGEVAYSLIARGSFAFALLGSVDLPDLDCVRLRARAANGVLSVPVTVCGDQQPVRELPTERVECTTQGPAWRGENAELIYLMADDDAHATAEEPVEADASVPDEVPAVPDTVVPDAAVPDDAPDEVVPGAEPSDEGAAAPVGAAAPQKSSASSGCTAMHRAAQRERAPITWLALLLSLAVLIRRRRSR